MLSLRLAWRSFLRQRRRSIITGAAVAVSLAMMIAFVGMGDDAHARMAELGIRLGAGHVLVHGRGYQESQTLDQLVGDPAPVIARARALPQVTLAVPRVRASGLLSTGESTSPVLVSGVVPDLEAQASDLANARHRVAGDYLRPRAAMPFANQLADLYLGQELARTLNAGVGDRVVLTVSPRGAARPAAAAFLVRGIFRTGVAELDQGYVEVPIDELQRLLGLEHQVTQVAVMVRALDDTARVAAALRQELPASLEVLPWQQALKELHDAIVLDDAGLYLMMAIIFVIVTIGIFNTVLMSVVERTREFGVMMALGVRPGQIFRLVLVEGLILAAVAAAVGVGLGLGIHLWLSRVGVDVTAWTKDYQIAGIVMEGRVYSRLTAVVVTKWTLVVIGLTLAAALYPALRATRLVPVEAIHRV
jgi:ABC-type lipoprotein release transport system permease subunit